jgi:hypothetical protein
MTTLEAELGHHPATVFDHGADVVVFEKDRPAS